MSANFYLTDEFVEFSKNIAEVHGRKKAKQAEIAAIFEQAKKELSIMDEEATGLEAKWNEFTTKYQNQKTKKE